MKPSLERQVFIVGHGFVAKLVLVFLVAAVLVGTSAWAEENITIMHNDVKVYINGVLTNFEDEYGQVIEPFIYQGKVYLPLNSVVEALGMSYAWDGNAMSVQMGAAEGEEQLLLDVCPPYKTDEVEIYSSKEGSGFVMAGNSYTNGFTMKAWSTGGGYALINLNGSYENVSFTLGHVDDAKMGNALLQVFLDGELLQEIPVPAEDLPRQVTIPVNHALSMKLNAYTTDTSSMIGLGEITVN